MSKTTPMSREAQALIESVKAAGQQGLPPVEKWDPDFTGDLDMRIDADGTWYHEGGEIERPALVRLFASVLKREGERYFLVTPVEKYGIEVEDVPFIAIDVDVSGEGKDAVLTFTTNLGDTVEAGPDDPIRVDEDPETGEPSPYVHVRRGLEARIDRKSFYRLADIGQVEGSRVVVHSHGTAFPIGPAA